MNRYGRMAYDHASQHQPKSFASMADPTAHFARVGEEVENRITTLRDQILGSLPAIGDVGGLPPAWLPGPPPGRGDGPVRDGLDRAGAGEPPPTTTRSLAYRSRLVMVSRTLASGPGLDRGTDGAATNFQPALTEPRLGADGVPR